MKKCKLLCLESSLKDPTTSSDGNLIHESDEGARKSSEEEQATTDGKSVGNGLLNGGSMHDFVDFILRSRFLRWPPAFDKSNSHNTT